jgi:hypothetical protein
MGLASFLAVPRRVVLAGRPYAVCELRLRDLAELEAMALARPAADPRELLAAAQASPDPAARRRLLRRAYDAAEAVGFGGESTLAILDREAAARLMLRASLRKHRPRVGAGDLANLIAEMDEGDWARLDRVAFGGDARGAASAAIDAELGIVLPTPPEGDGLTWAEATVKLATKLRLGPARLASVGELTLSQVRALLGSDPSPATEVPPDRVAEVSKRRAEFWAEDTTTDGGPTVASRQIVVCDRCSAEIGGSLKAVLRVDHGPANLGRHDLCVGCVDALSAWMAETEQVGAEAEAPEAPESRPDPSPEVGPADRPAE